MMPGLDEEDPLGMAGMGPSPEDRLRDWIEQTVFTRGAPGTLLQLCHCSMNGEVPTMQWNWPEDFEQQGAASIATTIYGHAEEDANEQQSVARYAVNASDAAGRRFARIMFRISPADLDINAARAGDTEMPHTQEGHVAQAYRHVETLMRMNLAMQLSTARQNTDLHQELGRTRTQLHQQQIQSVELFQNMKDRTTMREMMLSKHNRGETMKNMAMGLVVKFVPHIAQRIGLITDEEHAQMHTTEAVVNWMASMSEEHGRTMMDAITDPNERAAFERAWISAKKRAAAHAARAALSGKPAAPQLGGGATGTAAGAVGAAAATTAVAGAAVAAANSAGAAQQPAPIVFSAEESVPLTATTIALLHLLLNVDDAVFEVVLPRVPAAGQQEVRALHQRIYTEGHKPSADEWRSIVVNVRPFIIEMLAAASSQDIVMLLTQIDSATHKLAVQQAHTIVRRKLGLAT